MKTTNAVLLAFTLSMLALSSQADNPNQPNCPPGHIAILDPDGVDGWDCKQMEFTSNINPQDAGLLLPAVQKLSAAAPTAPAQPGGLKPTCPMGQVAKLEQGFWQCQQLDIKSNAKPQKILIGLLLPAVQKVSEAGAPINALAQPVGPKPTCPVAQIAKLEQGFWQCKKMHIAAPKKPE